MRRIRAFAEVVLILFVVLSPILASGLGYLLAALSRTFPVVGLGTLTFPAFSVPDRDAFTGCTCDACPDHVGDVDTLEVIQCPQCGAYDVLEGVYDV